MKTEVYRSFDVLRIDGPHDGYAIYDVGGDTLEYRTSSIDSDVKPACFRAAKRLIPPERYSDSAYLSELLIDAQYGRRDGLLYQYRGRWYGPEMIDAIRAQHRDMEWQRYI